MILKIINPNMTESMTASIARCAQKNAEQTTTLLCESAAFGVDSIECFTDEYLSVPAILRAIAKGDREQNVDAYIIACFDDPGLNAAREFTEKPVIGIAEAAMTAARFIAPSFSIVSILDRSRKMTEELVRRNAAQSFCRSIRTTGLGVLEFERNTVKGIEALAFQAEKAVEEDGAECILLGCAGFAGFAEELGKQLGVPVIDGVTAAVKFAEALTVMGLKTSKICSWKEPEPKKYSGYENFENL